MTPRKAKDRILASGISLRTAARKAGVRHSDLFNFFACRTHAIARASRIKIRTWLIAQGYLIVKPRKAPTCINCHLEYPTRKIHPVSKEVRGQDTTSRVSNQ
jgi:hypothetical protein